jgi:hypothetical protein
VSQLENAGGFSFPILKNPASVFGLFMGKDADLVRFDMPDLSFNLPYNVTFPILPFVQATLGGSLGVSLHAHIGYNTRGLRELGTALFVNHTPASPGLIVGDLLNGFYVTDDTKATVSVTLSAGAGVGLIPGVADVNVVGNLSANLSVALHDDNKDGDKLLNLDEVNPGDVFDLSGSVTASLSVTYHAVFFSGTQTLVSATLFNFSANQSDGNGPPGTGQSNQTPTNDMYCQNGSYLTSAAGTVLTNAQNVTLASSGLPAPPSGANFPFGIFHLTLVNVTPGGATTVVLTTATQTIADDDPTHSHGSDSEPDGDGDEPSAAPNHYYKYGPTPDNPAPHWYQFDYDGTTGAEAPVLHTAATHITDPDTGGEDPATAYWYTITIHYVDGKRGDDDLTANGAIVDPGAPVFVLPPAPPVAPPPPSLPPAPGPSPNQVFVTRLYQALFGAPPTPAAVAFLSQRLDQGASPFQVVLDLLHSPEYRLLRVQGLYRTLLHRRPSKKELARALRFLAHGGTLQQLEVWLFASAEYFQKRAGGTGAGFLQALFHDVLGQSPDPRTVLAIGGLLAEASWRLEAATILLQSLPAKVHWVADMYEQFLHVRPDGKSLRHYVSRLQRGVSENVVLADLLASPAYFAQV